MSEQPVEILDCGLWWGHKSSSIRQSSWILHILYRWVCPEFYPLMKAMMKAIIQDKFWFIWKQYVSYFNIFNFIINTLSVPQTDIYWKNWNQIPFTPHLLESNVKSGDEPNIGMSSVYSVYIPKLKLIHSPIWGIQLTFQVFYFWCNLKVINLINHRYWVMGNSNLISFNEFKNP